MSQHHETHHHYDKAYKTLFENKEVFVQFAQDFISQPWAKQITPEDLELANTHFTTDHSDTLNSDLIFRATLNDREVYFYILLEFQSSVDYSMPIRLLLYEMELWQTILKQYLKKQKRQKGYKLPAIVPIVIYNGEARWTAATSLKDKFIEPELFDRSVLNFEYILIDIQRYAKEELQQKPGGVSAVFMLEQCRTPEDYLNCIQTLATQQWIQKEQQLNSLINWIQQMVEPAMSKVVIQSLHQSKKGGVPMVSTLRQMLDEYKAEQRREGHEEGREEMKRELAKSLLDVLPDEEIAKRFQLPLEVVESLHLR